MCAKLQIPQFLPKLKTAAPARAAPTQSSFSDPQSSAPPTLHEQLTRSLSAVADGGRWASRRGLADGFSLHARARSCTKSHAPAHLPRHADST